MLGHLDRKRLIQIHLIAHRKLRDLLVAIFEQLSGILQDLHHHQNQPAIQLIRPPLLLFFSVNKQGATILT